jgi:hypothetical protein
MRTLLLRLIATLAAAAAALGSSCQWGIHYRGSTTSSSSASTASATGLWSGSDSASGLGVTVIINAAGEAVFMRSDGIVFTGSAQVSNDSLAVAVDGYSDFPSTFSDGSNYGIGTLNGTVSSGVPLDASLSFTTNGNTPISGNWSLNYAAQSNNASSTSAISGSYTDSVTGAVLSISSDGVMTSQSAANGCVLNGSVTTNDGSHDIYEVAYGYGDCTGTYAPLNGVQLSGLATLNTSVSPAQLTLVVTGASSSSKYAVVSILTHT